MPTPVFEKMVIIDSPTQVVPLPHVRNLLTYSCDVNYWHFCCYETQIQLCKSNRCSYRLTLFFPMGVKKTCNPLSFHTAHWNSSEKQTRKPRESRGLPISTPGVNYSLVSNFPRASSSFVCRIHWTAYPCVDSCTISCTICFHRGKFLMNRNSKCRIGKLTECGIN